jgi:hypothetical protein
VWHRTASKSELLETSLRNVDGLISLAFADGIEAMVRAAELVEPVDP